MWREQLITALSNCNLGDRSAAVKNEENKFQNKKIQKIRSKKSF
jgi:hypothetical protein